MNVQASVGNSNIYAVCYNDMHCSQSRTNVINIGSYSPSQSGNNTNGNNTNNNNTNTGSSVFVKFEMMLLAMILFAFFLN